MKRTLLSAFIAWCVCLAVFFAVRRLHFGVLLLSNILAAAIIEILLFGMTQRRWMSFSAAVLIVFTAQFTVVIPSIHRMAVYPVNMDEMRARAKQDRDREMSEYLKDATEEDVRRTSAKGLILSTCVIFIPTIVFGALAGRRFHRENGGGSSTAE
jgi:glucan phosphoethanolaminetransferase (alkaline phosphatase superfamily)